MTDVLFIILYLAVGFITGILSALFGIGGGIVFVPALLVSIPSLIGASDIAPFVAVSTSLFAGSFSSSAAFVNHFRIKNIEFKYSFYLASGSVITAVILPHFLVQTSSEYVKYLLMVILSIVALKMFLDKNLPTAKRFLPDYAAFFIGAVIGVLPSLVGIGGGIFFVQILHYFYGLDIKRAVGTSTLAVAFTVISSAISYGFAECPIRFDYQFGYIHLLVGLTLGLGAVVGSYCGIVLLKHFQSNKLKKYFAILILIIVIKLLF